MVHSYCRLIRRNFKHLAVSTIVREFGQITIGDTEVIEMVQKSYTVNSSIAEFILQRSVERL